jgi:hypothetical protein
MGDYPQGGIGIQNNDIGSVELFGCTYAPFTFTPPGADTTYEKGLILARKVADDDLVPFVEGAGDSTGVPIAVLGENVNSDSGPADVNLRAIIGGRVRAEKVYTLAGGVGVALSADVVDALRTMGIDPQNTLELANVDNPQP